MVSRSVMTRMLGLALRGILLTTGGLTYAASLSIVDVPLFLSGNVAPLNMLVVGRDHKLYYEAYRPFGSRRRRHPRHRYRGFDDPPRTGVKIDYYGYFDSYTCYTHDGAKFVPASQNTTKTCSGQWSGDLAELGDHHAHRRVAQSAVRRKALLDSTRRRCSSARSFRRTRTAGARNNERGRRRLPIRHSPRTPRPPRHYQAFFTNTTLLLTTTWTTNTEPPLLRVLLDQPSPRRIWNWVSKEAPVAGASMDTGSGNFR